MKSFFSASVLSSLALFVAANVSAAPAFPRLMQVTATIHEEILLPDPSNLDVGVTSQLLYQSVHPAEIKVRYVDAAGKVSSATWWASSNSISECGKPGCEKFAAHGFVTKARHSEMGNDQNFPEYGVSPQATAPTFDIWSGGETMQKATRLRIPGFFDYFHSGHSGQATFTSAIDGSACDDYANGAVRCGEKLNFKLDIRVVH